MTRFVESIVGQNPLSRTRHDVLVILPPKGSDLILPIDGCTVLRLDFSWRRVLSSLRRFRAIASPYDALMIHAAHPVAVLPLLLNRQPCLFFQHGMSVSSGPWYKRVVKKIWFSMIPRLANARVVCSTRFALEKARGLGIRIRERDAVIVPFGISSSRDGYPVNETTPDGSRITVGMAGRLVEQKRADLPLRSLAAYAGKTKLRLLIAGDGPLKEELQDIASFRNPQVEIRFLGQVSDMVSFYDELDLLILPSRGESFGLVVLEAFDRGVPVAVFPDVGGCLQLVKNGENGFVLNAGQKGLQALWRQLDADPTILHAMKDRLARLDMNSYDIATTRKNLERLVFANALHVDTGVDHSPGGTLHLGTPTESVS